MNAKRVFSLFLALALLLTLGMPFASADGASIIDLKTNGRVDPLGVDTAQPAFSWRVTDEFAVAAGLIVDYCGILRNLREALATFADFRDGGRNGGGGGGGATGTSAGEGKRATHDVSGNRGRLLCAGGWRRHISGGIGAGDGETGAGRRGGHGGGRQAVFNILY